MKEEMGSDKICLDPEAIRKLKTDINLIEKGLIRKEDMRKANELGEEIDNMKTPALFLKSRLSISLITS
jgi:hypothetical protein